jgi:hypothetical protein
MEEYSFERAQDEAKEIQEIAHEAKRQDIEAGDLTRDDYENANIFLDQINEKIKKLSLSELLQEPTRDYSWLINEADRNVFDDRSALQANHSSPWSSYNKVEGRPGQADHKLLELFERTIPGNILCELGGASGRMELFTASNNAELYLNVDKYPRGTKKDSTPINPGVGSVRKAKYRDTITDTVYLEGVHLIMGVRADMLDFVSRIKDASVNVVINGIDGDLIPVEEYHESLAKEILRVTKENGIIFGNNSSSLNIICERIQADPLLGSHYDIVKKEQGVIVIYKK